MSFELPKDCEGLKVPELPDFQKSIVDAVMNGNAFQNPFGDALGGVGDMLSGAGGIGESISSLLAFPDGLDSGVVSMLEGLQESLGFNSGFGGASGILGTLSEFRGHMDKLSGVGDLSEFSERLGIGTALEGAKQELGLGAGGFGGAGNPSGMNEYYGGGGGTAGSADTVIIDIKNLKELAWAAAGLETGVTAPTSADPSGDNLPTITFTINTTQIGAAGAQATGGTSPGGAASSGGMGYVTESGVLAQLNLDSLSGVSAQNSLIQLSADGGSNPDFTLDQASAETINFKGGTGITTAGTGSSGTPANTITINLDNVSIANGGTGSTSASGARTNLGLGTISTLGSISNSNWSGTDLSIANGGTGASTADAARDALDIQVHIEAESAGTPSVADFTNANAIFVVQY